MKEFYRRPGISRRRFMIGSAGLAAGVVVGFADHHLKDGLIIDAPELNANFKRINAALPGVNLPLGRAIEIGYKREYIRLNDRTFVHINSDGELIYQHVDAMFDLDREYNIPHRSGNRGYLIEEAIDIGAEGFDIDATDTNDKIFAEHGMVGEVDIMGMSLGGVLDINEGEIRSRTPRTVEEVVEDIAAKSNRRDPYVLEMQLKRGPFTCFPAMIDLNDAISRSGMPMRVFGESQESVDNFYLAAQMYAKRMGTL